MTNAGHATDKRTRVRFLILLLIFLLTTINYADRATFSIAGDAASKDLGLDPVQMGYILSAFAWAYVLGPDPRRRPARPVRHQADLCAGHRALVVLHPDPGLLPAS